jgi:hypothetical protein
MRNVKKQKFSRFDVTGGVRLGRKFQEFRNYIMFDGPESKVGEPLTCVTSHGMTAGQPHTLSKTRFVSRHYSFQFIVAM